jgi:hypothetical protein
MVGNEIQTMSLKDIKNEITKLNNQLLTYLNLKQISFETVTGTTSRMKDILVSKTDFVFDKFTHYLIKDEKYDNKIYSLQQSIAEYEKLLFREMERYRKYDDLSLIIYLRDEEKWSWKKIDRILNYSDDVSRVKYSRYKNEKK